MLQVQEEHVLVAPTARFHELGHFQGFCSRVDRYLPQLLDPGQVSYRPRAEMERDPSFKQLIPYCIFRHVDAAGNVMLFQYTRGKGQGEQRLHSKRSIGVGGHISLDDAGEGAASDPYAEGLRRELDEEVFIESTFRSQCVGLINDDETEVGRVHLGVVHLIDVDRPAVRSRESELVESGFRSVAEIQADVERFETWSKICLDALFTPD